MYVQAAYEENYNSPTEQKSNVKPLLKDLESRMVFTKCKPFKLDIPDRQWIFGKIWNIKFERKIII